MNTETDYETIFYSTGKCKCGRENKHFVENHRQLARVLHRHGNNIGAAWYKSGGTVSQGRARCIYLVWFSVHPRFVRRYKGVEILFEI